jgi:hypothetical protein
VTSHLHECHSCGDLCNCGSSAPCIHECQESGDDFDDWNHDDDPVDAKKDFPGPEARRATQT